MKEGLSNSSKGSVFFSSNHETCRVEFKNWSQNKYIKVKSLKSENQHIPNKKTRVVMDTLF